jgi:protein-S-isoprenylcysteine O-methyltransferase Ste14
MAELIIGILVSIVIIYLSRQSLGSAQMHGFYRFFAFEAILVSILLRVRTWFHDPFSWHQLISWILLLASLALVIHGFWLLRKIGRPEGRIENTRVLVRIGVYHWIRHPLYASLLGLAWGVYFKDPNLVGFLLACVASAFLYATAAVEEKENLARFGKDYKDYMEETRRFIPYLF